MWNGKYMKNVLCEMKKFMWLFIYQELNKYDMKDSHFVLQKVYYFLQSQHNSQLKIRDLMMFVDKKRLFCFLMERLVRTEWGTESPAALTQSKVQVFGWMMLLIYWHLYYKHGALALFLLLILSLSLLSHRHRYLFLQFFLRRLLLHLL